MGRKKPFNSLLELAGEKGQPILLKGLNPSYYICSTCGKPYLHTRFSDAFYCDDCLSDRNRGIGPE
jgi:hypothetical protein